ncbi:MAG TPA: hypothetical protein DCS67_04815 [Clostridiales bacterium UBA8960]|nr:hypothetical protein [Clostridiales bacterium UBA8960]
MQRIKFYNSLRFQLVMVVILLILIPVGFIGFLLAGTIEEIFNEKYSSVAIQSIKETTDKIDYLLSDIQDYTISILANRSFLELISSPTTTDKEIDEALRGFLASRNDIDGISLITASGTYAIGTNKTTPLISIQQMVKNQSDSKPLWLPTVQQNIRILSGISSRYYFSVVRNIIDFNTLENYGTLVVDIEEVLLEQAYENLLSTGGDVTIIDEQGYIVSHSDERNIGFSIMDQPYSEAVLSLDENSNAFTYQTKEGDEKIAFFSTLKTNGWHVVQTISKEELYGEIYLIQSIFLLSGAVYAILMMILLIMMSIQYTDPMLKIIRDLKRVEKGDLTVRTEVHTKNEMHQLSESVNTMIMEMEQLIDRLVEEERMKREVELEALHAQINPHFLYNTLNTIKWMAKIQGATSVSNAIVALVKLLRISINISTDFITLKEEIEYIQNYIVIQKLRFNEDFEILYEIDESVEQAQIPKLILQPIIENSIIYGMESSESLKITVAAHADGDMLTIKLSDNGPGIPENVASQIAFDLAAGKKMSKAGLNNTSQRIKLFCGDAYGIDLLTREGEGTTVIVRLPVNLEGERHV